MVAFLSLGGGGSTRISTPFYELRLEFLKGWKVYSCHVVQCDLYIGLLLLLLLLV